ncbi:MAG: hypothetical protein RML72_01395 [Bacteroidia bacterium]|nr:hypothetical protein [Bacteroidia bacterium]MDW8157513.1 hypothetical protein [Bacteroidia bacterium]
MNKIFRLIYQNFYNLKYYLVGCAFLTHFRVYAQPTNRIDDHFQRNKRLIAIDLNEKINSGLVECNDHADRFYDIYQRYIYRCGLVSALLESFLSNKVAGFDPNDLQRSITPHQFLGILNSFVNQLDLENEKENEFSSSDEELQNLSSEDFEEGEEEENEYELEPKGVIIEEQKSTKRPITLDLLYLKALQNKIEIIEDVVFDLKNASQNFIPTYIIVKWVNPYGLGVQASLVAFKYSDVIKVLDQTQWKNRFNDSEDRSIRQVFDLRLFNFIILNYSGSTSKNLFQAEKIREKIVNFEHDLWEF